jgi:serine/threonine protein kinase
MTSFRSSAYSPEGDGSNASKNNDKDDNDSTRRICIPKYLRNRPSFEVSATTMGGRGGDDGSGDESRDTSDVIDDKENERGNIRSSSNNDNNNGKIQHPRLAAQVKTVGTMTLQRRTLFDPLEIDVSLVNSHHYDGGYTEEGYNNGRNNSNCNSSSNIDSNSTTTEYQFGDTTYRQDGFTIGKDYLRLNGATITRGELFPTNLVMNEFVGRGAFSQVHKGIWTKRIKATQQQQQQDFLVVDSTTSRQVQNFEGHYQDEEKKDGENACIVHSTIRQHCVQKERQQIPVAIKECSILDASSQRKDMLLKEIRVLCQLQSEALVAFYGAFLRDDIVVTVMEYMDGGSLEQWLKNKRQCEADVTDRSEKLDSKGAFLASISYQTLCGLEYLHSRRILHRDVKPGNILLHSDGSVKLCDFGIASLSDQSLNTTVVGTSRYMSPERLRGRPYGRPSDIWSLGLVMVECWTGNPPWSDCDSVVSLVITVEETPSEDLIPWSVDEKENITLKHVLLGCLQHLPEKRMPATILHMAPWFKEQHKINTMNDARKVLLQSWK